MIVVCKDCLHYRRHFFDHYGHEPVCKKFTTTRVNPVSGDREVEAASLCCFRNWDGNCPDYKPKPKKKPRPPRPAPMTPGDWLRGWAIAIVRAFRRKQ